MTSKEMNRSAATLRQLERELSNAMKKREDIYIERQPDELDETQSASMRDLVVADLNRRRRNLTQIEDALDRIEEGSYGICEDCEQPIAPRRLEAIPWATYCVRCQERRDDMAGNSEDSEINLSSAA